MSLSNIKDKIRELTAYIRKYTNYFFYCITKALVTAIEFAGKGAGRFGENGKIGVKNKFLAAKGLASGEKLCYAKKHPVDQSHKKR